MFTDIYHATNGWSIGGGGITDFNISKSKATLFDGDSKVTVTFKDVAGLEAKTEVMEIVDFKIQKIHLLGGKIPKGALLIGLWHRQNVDGQSHGW